MGVETRAFTSRNADLERISEALTEWLVRERGFTAKLNTPLADGRLIKLEKSDFGGRLTGLIYTLDITLQRDGETVRVTVDDGDLRNQVVALGLGALFMTMLWPLLLTAGYGWIQKGEIRGAVIAYVAGLLNAPA